MMISPVDDSGAPPRAMHTRYGPLFRWLFNRFFGPVHFPEDAQERLEDLASRGTIVYVMRSAGILNFLYFNWAFARRGLPLAKAVLGIRTFLYRPLNFRAQRRSSRGADAVVEAARSGEASMVFLRRPSVLRSHGASTSDPFEGLIALQRRRLGEASRAHQGGDASELEGGAPGHAGDERPIFLVPQLLIFKRAPSRLRPGISDVVLGSAEVPGRLHAFTSFLFNYKRSVVKIGLPIDLSELVRSYPERSDAVLARMARGSLGVGLARELRSVVGPKLKSQERLIEETLRDRILRAELQEVAKERGSSFEAVEQEATQCLLEISAKVSHAWLDGANTIARWVFNRLYDGIEVDEEGLRLAAEASKRAPLVLCPTHRSHIDYILISHVLIERGVTPPLVAAGANLSFWPLGPMFRRMGAFFIRRSFKGERVYAAALAAYVRKLVRDGYTQEFYPEGGRTRTGRILQPKYGLVSIEVDAWIAGARDDLCFVPIAIDYAKVIEATSYAKELAGGEKRREDLKGLLMAPAVLRSRWGRVHLQVDRPISLAAFAKERGFDPGDHGEEERKAFVRALAHRIAHRMGRVQTVTASSLVSGALLGSTHDATAAGELGERIELLRTLARHKGARFSAPTLAAASDPIAPGAIREALEGFVEDGMVEQYRLGGEASYRPKAGARASLDFYKNNIAHHYEEESILAAALLALGGEATDADVTEEAGHLSWLLKRELSFRSDVSLEIAVREATQTLAALGLIVAEGGALEVRAGREEALRFLRNQLADVIEAYLVAMNVLEELSGGPMERKRFIERCFILGQDMLERGRINRRESLSKPTFERAVSWLVDVGRLAEGSGRSLSLEGSFRERAAREALRRRIARFLL